jgi:hypothetical protein
MVVLVTNSIDEPGIEVVGIEGIPKVSKPTVEGEDLEVVLDNVPLVVAMRVASSVVVLLVTSGFGAEVATAEAEVDIEVAVGGGLDPEKSKGGPLGPPSALYGAAPNPP